MEVIFNMYPSSLITDHTEIKIKFEYIFSRKIFKNILYIEDKKTLKKLLSQSSEKKHKKYSPGEILIKRKNESRSSKNLNSINIRTFLSKQNKIPSSRELNKSRSGECQEEHTIEVNFCVDKIKDTDSRITISYLNSNSHFTLSYEVDTANNLTVEKIESAYNKDNIINPKKKIDSSNELGPDNSISKSESSYNESIRDSCTSSHRSETKSRDNNPLFKEAKQISELIFGGNSNSKSNECDSSQSNAMLKFEQKYEIKIEKNYNNNFKSNYTMCNKSNNQLDPLAHCDKILSKFEEIQFDKTMKENFKPFCQNFFISGAPFDNAKIIQNSENLLSPCEHTDCSILPGYQPEILYRFPRKDYNNFELNNSVTSFCFPTGLKFCYEQNEKKIPILKSFTNIITNVYGERMYVINYHFYKKYDFVYYQSHFINSDPLREFFKSRSLLLSVENNKIGKKNNELEKKYTKEIDICCNLLNNEYVYVPYCFSFVSQTPNVKELEKIIEILLKIISKKKNNSLNILNEKLLEETLTHLLFEVPIPAPNSVISLYLPYYSSPIEIKGLIYNNLPKLNYQASILFNYFSVENIILIHQLLLFEQKILFVTTKKDYSILLPVIEAFVSLLYPLKWVHVYIPVLSEDSLVFLQSFMPFLMGIDDYLLHTAATYTYLENNAVYLVDINKNTVNFMNEKKSKKVEIKTLGYNIKKFINFFRKNLPKMPLENFEFLSFEIKKLKKEYEDCRSFIKKSVSKLEKKNLNTIMDVIELEFRRAFIKSMAIFYGDYLPFTSKIDGVTYFNQNSFVSTRSSCDFKFYDEFLQSQNFKLFLQISMNHSEYDYYFYFEHLCEKYRYYLNSNNYHLEHLYNKNVFEWNNIFKTAKSSSEKRIKFINDALKSDIINFKNLNTITDENKSKLEKLFYNEDNADTASKSFILLPFFFLNRDHYLKQNSMNDNLIRELFENDVENQNSEKIIKELCETIYPEEKEDNINMNKILDIHFNFKIFDKILHDFPSTIKKYNLDTFETDFDSDPPQRENTHLNPNIQHCPNSRSILYNSKNNLKSPSKKLTSLKSFQTHSSNSVNKERELDQYQNENKCMIQRQLTLIKEKRDKILQESEVKETPMSYMATAVRRKQSILGVILNSNSQKELDAFQIQIHDMIKDYMELVLTSQSTHEGFHEISCLFHSRYARSKFAAILYQDKFIANNPHCLNEVSFNELFKILCNALLLCERDISQYEDIRLVTKSTLFYYKNPEGSLTGANYFLYEEIAKKKKSFLVWKHLEFWKFYVDSELAEMESNYSTEFDSLEDFYFTMILNVVLFMNNLNLDLEFIKNSFVNVVVTNYLIPDSKFYKELVNKISKLVR